MRKFTLMSVVALSVLALTSCEKAAQLLFKPFESPLNFNVTIPVISSTANETSMGSSNVAFNLDEEVKEHTDGKLDGDVVGAMYINQVAITLTDSDGNNNLSNFEYVTVSVSSGSSTPVVYGPFTVPNGATTTASFTVANSANIKPFFSGSTVKFELRGKAKKATTKTLQANVGATIKFDK